VAALVEGVARALEEVATWEIIFVDDSDDATPEAVVAAGRRAPVRLHHRPAGRRAAGLGGAVMEGFASARGRVVAVMDGDLQHPPDVLPRLVGPVLAGQADLVAGTRYDAGGAAAGLSGPWRVTVSRSARRLVHALVPASRCLSDPMSGLFAVDPALLTGVQLRPCGFKILLELTVRAQPQRVGNVAFRFADRRWGRSKAGPREGLRLARLVWRLRRAGSTGRWTGGDRRPVNGP